MDKASVELPWPMAGIDRALAYQSQPPYTTPDAQNVRVDGMQQFRERGGSRPGLGLAIRTQLPSDIRLLTKVSVVKADWPQVFSPLGGRQLQDYLVPVLWSSTPTYAPGDSYSGYQGGLLGQDWGRGIPIVDYSDKNKPYEASVHVRLADGKTAFSGEVQICLGLPSATADPDDDSVKVRLIFTGGTYQVIVDEVIGGVTTTLSTGTIYSDNPNAPGRFSVRVIPGTNSIQPFWRFRGMAIVSASTLSNHYVSTRTISADESIFMTQISTEFGRDTSLPTVFDDLRRDVLVAVSNGLIYMEDTADSLKLIDTDVDVSAGVDLVAADREQLLYIADYGVAINGSGASIAGDSYNELTDSSRNFTALGIDANYVMEFLNSDYSQNEKQAVFVDQADGGTFRLVFRGQQTSALAYNASAASVKAALEALTTMDTVTVTGTGADDDPWVIEFTGENAGRNVESLTYDASGLTFTGTGDPIVNVSVTQQGAGGDLFQGHYQVTGVSATSLTFSPALPVAEGFTADIGAVLYRIVRSAKIFDPREETMYSHVAVAGTVPGGCRLVTVYRDRIVYASGDLFPHIRYMSRQGDPLDWDYSQEDSAAAVAAQNSVAGQLADPITALIPHSDECLVFGCYTSLWILRGDPGYGGTIDQLSRKVGIVSANAWCRTPNDMVVFLSPDGLYVMPAGCAGMPTSLSRERLPDELLCLNGARESIHLEYDMVCRGIHIFTTKRDGSGTTHWWFDWESKSFWRFSIDTDYEPFATHERIAWDDCPIVLVGGRDGYIRYFDRQFTVDDGDQEIASYCDIGPIHLDPENQVEGLLTEIQGVLGVHSGEVAWELRAGQSAQEAYEASVVQATGTWGKQGLNYTSHPRVRGVSAFLRIKNSGKVRWFLERISAKVRTAGRRRA